MGLLVNCLNAAKCMYFVYKGLLDFSTLIYFKKNYVLTKTYSLYSFDLITKIGANVVIFGLYTKLLSYEVLRSFFIIFKNKYVYYKHRSLNFNLHII